MAEKEKVKVPDITFGKALLCIVGLIIVLALGFAIIGFDTKVTFLIASIVVGCFLVAYGYELNQVISWYADGCKGAIEMCIRDSIEGLRGHTSGYAVPTFVVDAPGGGGKTPVMPQYVISQTPHKVILRNYEGVITTYTCLLYTSRCV